MECLGVAGRQTDNYSFIHVVDLLKEFQEDLRKLKKPTRKGGELHEEEGADSQEKRSEMAEITSRTPPRVRYRAGAQNSMF